MLRDAWAVFVKDLRIEAVSRVGLWQVLPFAVIALLLFAFALGPSHQVLASGAAGVKWVGVVFAVFLIVGRSQSIETGAGIAESQRLAGIDPAGVFLGKAAAVAVQLLAVEALLGVGARLLLDYHCARWWLVVVSSLLATIGLAAAGTLYGALVGATRARETLLPMLVLPVLVPVLIAVVRLWQAAGVSEGQGLAGWLSILGTFAVIYTSAGILFYGQVQEHS
ncbi:MAG: heme exporter protein CcmB [Actinomycetota bacterium]